jgi:hypothetical protein
MNGRESIIDSWRLHLAAERDSPGARLRSSLIDVD